MRILILSQWFTPEPTFKGMAFARALQQSGHEVEVLTGFPNYPGGKVYDGYRVRLLQKEVIDGIRINRVALYPSHDTSAVKRILNYVSFAISASIGGLFVVSHADVMYVYHPPATIALPAIVIRAFRRIPFVIDIQDLWPDTLASTGMVRNKAILGLVAHWCRLAYRVASRIAVLSPGFKRELIRRGVPADKIEVIYNWCEEESLARKPVGNGNPDELGFTGKFNIVFAGTMGKAQALDAVLESAKLIEKDTPHVQIVFIGGGIDAQRLKDIASKRMQKNVRFLPRMRMDEIGDVLRLADVLLIHLKDDLLFEITIPGKTQAYLSVGRPIIMAVRGDAADLITTEDAGIVCEPENQLSIADAVRRMVQMPPQERADMGKRGHEFYEKYLSLRIGVEKFEVLFRSVMKS